MTPFQLNDNCNGDPEYSVTACLKAFVGRKVGCSLQWFNHEDLPRCKSIEQLLETKAMLGNIETVKCILHISCYFQALLTWIKNTHRTKLEEKTGCLIKCPRIKVDYKIEDEF